MRIIRSRRGAGLVDVMITVFVLGVCGLIFGTTFASGYTASRQAEQYKVATAIAQRKMEQVRALNYESLTYTSLQAGPYIDDTPNISPYQFTGVDGLATALPKGAGTLAIEDISGTELRKVTITVTWEGTNGASRNVTLTTWFADRRTRAG